MEDVNIYGNDYEEVGEVKSGQNDGQENGSERGLEEGQDDGQKTDA